MSINETRAVSRLYEYQGYMSIKAISVSMIPNKYQSNIDSIKAMNQYQGYLSVGFQIDRELSRRHGSISINETVSVIPTSNRDSIKAMNQYQGYISVGFPNRSGAIMETWLNQ